MLGYWLLGNWASHNESALTTSAALSLAQDVSDEIGAYNYFIMAIASINPTTGETLKTFEALSAEQIEKKLQCAADTFRTYRRTSFEERGRMMVRAAEILESDKNAFAKIMTTEMGKPIKAAIMALIRTAGRATP